MGMDRKKTAGLLLAGGRGGVGHYLAGERGHYELAAGRDAKPFIRAMEGFSSATGLLPEQVWDEPDRPDVYMFLGRPTGSAMPLMWAHAEYIKLLRSVADGRVFDLIPEVAERYLSGRNTRHRIRGVEAQSAGIFAQTELYASRPGCRSVSSALDER